MLQGLSNQSDNSDIRLRNARVSGAGDGPKSSVSSPGRLTESAANKATAAFVRRVLLGHHIQTTDDKTSGIPKSIDKLLPPLTSSNDVDLELYAFIAIILKDFVYSWYAKITPDHVFTDEIIRIIAHCCRALEQRARDLDTEALLLDEIPQLLDNHISGTGANFEHRDGRLTIVQPIALLRRPHDRTARPRQTYATYTMHCNRTLRSRRYQMAQGQRTKKSRKTRQHGVNCLREAYLQYSCQQKTWKTHVCTPWLWRFSPSSSWAMPCAVGLARTGRSTSWSSGPSRSSGLARTRKQRRPLPPPMAAGAVDSRNLVCCRRRRSF